MSQPCMIASPGGPKLRWCVSDKFAARVNRFAVRLGPGPSVIAFLLAAMLCMAEADAFAQTSAQTPAQRPAQTSPQPAAASAGQAQTTGTAAPVDAARVVEFLDQTIAWYRQLAEQQRLVANANDDVYVSADR